MLNHINCIQINGFRALSDLRIDSLGRVNLITGKNNAGKSSLLEAIRILATGGAFKTLYLDPFSSRSSQMGALWDAIALTDVEPEIVAALQIISKDIRAVSMAGSDERGSRARTAIARSTFHASPVPLRSFGDGVNRLFGIILSLCNARDGVLLVDEIENGLHYSVQTEIWRTIFRLANVLNVQVFASSHSWECVRAFQEAASESPQDGALVRLTRREGQIIPTLFSEQELAIVTRDQIEVR